MNDSVTRISDLPDLPSNAQTGNTYLPINIHQNPYGNNAGNMQPPTQQAPRMDTHGNMSPDQMAAIQNMSHQRLPSRDIHIDPADYLQDEETQPLYIPRSGVSSDFVRDYENVTEKKIRSREQEKHRERLIDRILNEIQVPLLVGVLFFLFQLPFINGMLFSRLSFLSLYDSSGNINYSGILVKSFMFASIFYSINKFSTWISEL